MLIVAHPLCRVAAHGVQCGLISHFTDSGFIMKSFTTSKFKEGMNRSGENINDHIKTLGLALAEGAWALDGRTLEVGEWGCWV